jgi:hypothetical protein
VTVSPYEQGGALAEGQFDDGMEDFDTTDAALPRLQIVHDDGQFKDSLSGATYDKLPVIILGLVKQRVMWDTTMEDDAKPMCRSTNFKQGYPLLPENAKHPSTPFDWQKSNFDPAQFPQDSDGVVILPCDACKFKDWGSHPDGKKPWCSEQWTLPILFDQTGGTDEPEWVGGIITFQKTALAPLKKYMTTFANTKTPPFRDITEFSLDLLQRGKTTYSVPKFKQIARTSPDDFLGYSATYRGIREFLTREPVRRESDAADAVATETAPAAAPSPAPAPQAAPVAEAPAPAPAAPAPAPQAAAPVATPAPQVATPTPTVTPPTPQVATPTPAPQAAAPAPPPTPAPQATAPAVQPQNTEDIVDAIVEEDDELPF